MQKLIISLLFSFHAVANIVIEEPMIFNGNCIPVAVGTIFKYNGIDYPVTTLRFFDLYYYPSDSYSALKQDYSVVENLEPESLSEVLKSSFYSEGMPTGETKFDNLFNLSKYFDVTVSFHISTEWETLKYELDNNRLVLGAVNLDYSSLSSDHAIVISGYEELETGEKLLYIYDGWTKEQKQIFYKNADINSIWGLTAFYSLHFGEKDRALYFLRTLQKDWQWKESLRHVLPELCYPLDELNQLLKDIEHE